MTKNQQQLAILLQVSHVLVIAFTKIILNFWTNNYTGQVKFSSKLRWPGHFETRRKAAETDRDMRPAGSCQSASP